MIISEQLDKKYIVKVYMNCRKLYALLSSNNILSKKYKSYFKKTSPNRFCYYLELQSTKFGNQWILTEFDAFSTNINDYLIPTKLIKRTVNNLSIKSSDGMNVENLDNVNEEVEEDGLEEDQKAPWE